MQFFENDTKVICCFETHDDEHEAELQATNSFEKNEFENNFDFFYWQSPLVKDSFECKYLYHQFVNDKVIVNIISFHVNAFEKYL